MSEFLAGVRLLGRGMAMYGRTPRLVVLGMIPALITLLLFVGLFVLLLVFIGDLAALATWFADGWSPGPRTAARVIVGTAIVGGALLLGIVSFTAVTLLVGDPFYEKISERIEDRFGGVPGAVELPWWRSVGDSLRLILISLCFTVPLFLAGFIPLIGQTVIPVIGALVGGWFLAVELIGVPFGRRGLRLPDRRRMLRAHRMTALGFGTAVFVCCLIPLAAIAVMPAAVAGGTLLARRVLGLSTEESERVGLSPTRG
jgi:CysZ protein